MSLESHQLATDPERKHIYGIISGISRSKIPFPIEDDDLAAAIGYQSFGQETVFNTYYSVKQLLMAMMVCTRKEVADVIGNLVCVVGQPDINVLLTTYKQRQALKGAKIMDLGCGKKPNFSRLARALGADVYTADVIKASSFNEISGCSSLVERYHHIVIDFNIPDASEKIMKQAGTGFTFVTESHVTTGTHWYQEELNADPIKKGAPYKCYSSENGPAIAAALLQPGGFYYNASDNQYWGYGDSLKTSTVYQKVY